MEKSLSVNITKENIKQLKRSIPYIIFVSILNLIIALLLSLTFVFEVLLPGVLEEIPDETKYVFLYCGLVVILFLFFNFLNLFKYAKSIKNVEKDIDQLVKQHVSFWKTLSIFIVLLIMGLGAISGI